MSPLSWFGDSLRGGLRLQLIGMYPVFSLISGSYINYREEAKHTSCHILFVPRRQNLDLIGATLCCHAVASISGYCIHNLNILHSDEVKGRGPETLKYVATLKIKVENGHY